ncbi:unnamed protein product [Tenebrio molitor]|nr:unnamed protein product [Tenebrio molitor]
MYTIPEFLLKSLNETSMNACLYDDFICANVGYHS